MSECFLESCSDKVYSKNYCHLHYYRNMHGRDLYAPKPRRYTICTVDGCLGKPHGSGLCAAHHSRKRRIDAGNTELSLSDPIRTQNGYQGCSVETCLGEHYATGYCAAHYDRDRKLKDKYSMSFSEFAEACAQQEGKCAICLHAPDKGLVVDHDHATGIVRGLLCNNCNVALGMLRENRATIRRAIDYLTT